MSVQGCAFVSSVALSWPQTTLLESGLTAWVHCMALLNIVLLLSQDALRLPNFILLTNGASMPLHACLVRGVLMHARVHVLIAHHQPPPPHFASSFCCMLRACTQEAAKIEPMVGDEWGPDT